MMTEQRAIDLLKGILPKKVSFAQMICASNCYGDEMVYQEPEPYAIEFAINSIQENTKLKAEIEQLKEEMERYKKLTSKTCESCEYEVLLGCEEPCDACTHYNKWKLKCVVPE